MTNAHGHPSAIEWARHLSGESSLLAGRRVRRHIARCPACRAYEAEQLRQRIAFEEDGRTREALERLRARASAVEGTRRRSRARWAWLVTFATASLGTVAFALWTRAPTGALVAKGEAFGVYVHRPSGAVPLGPRCAAGDRLIGRYRTARPYLLVVERDGRGTIQVLFPPAGGASGRVASGDGTTPTSWVLDDVRGRECFAAFFSEQPVTADDAVRALAAAPRAPALPGASAHLVCCDKGGAE